MRTQYLIDDFQRIYFVLDDFEQLFRSGYGTDFAPLYTKFRDTTPIRAGYAAAHRSRDHPRHAAPRGILNRMRAVSAP